MKGGGNHLKDSEDLPIKNNHHHHHNGIGITTKPLIWDQMAVRSPRIPSSSPLPSSSPSRAFPRLMYWLIFLITLTYLLYTAKLLFSSSSSSHHCIQSHLHQLQNNNNPETFIQISTATATATASPASTANSTATAEQTDPPPTPAAPSDDLSLSLHHIVFGIAASARYWEHRKNYTKIWWRPDQMRGIVWVDSPVKTHPAEKNLLPPVRISSDTSRFPYSNKQGHRSAIRISRIVSETLRLGLADVRWFVMGDDDTVFVADNLVRVLSKYDHRQPYYIGSLSESHLQNIHFSYGMAYGGGGFAISHPLAVTLGKMQDRCIHRYPGLYGSDDRIQACMAELGVPLTKEPGFHQYDVYGNLFGLLAAHPVAPLVTLHHLDVVEPVFPNATRVAGLRRIFDGPVRLDSAGVMQQSICYEGERKWTVSVSWGFAVQIIRGVLSPREMEMPARTFLNWYRRADYTAYAFNTRPVARNPCQKPFMYYLSAARFDRVAERTVTEYRRHSGGTHPRCKWKMAEPSAIDRVVVYKRPDPSLWSRSPRRNCCRILASGDRARGKSTMTIDVGLCREGEISEI